MPTPTQHKQQAEHNKAFTQHLDLDTTIYLDWIVTAAFYASLHFVEWFLTSKGHTGRRDHQLRDVYISREADLRAMYGDYTELKYQSEGARYECFFFTPDEVRNEILPLLDRIESHITSKLT
jgi:hypothetical protein